jgi:hypothetical protein
MSTHILILGAFDVDGNDARCASHFGILNDSEANGTQTKDRHTGTLFDFARDEDRQHLVASASRSMHQNPIS